MNKVIGLNTDAETRPASEGAFLWLTESDVVSLVNIDDAIDALEAGVAELESGKANNIPKALGLWGEGSSVHSLGSINPIAGYTGFKTWANTSKGANAIFTLFNADNGSIEAVFEAAALGSLRTSAISGLATRWLSAKGADELSIVGTGRQAIAQVAAIAAVRPIKRVRVFSPTPAKRIAFEELLRDSFKFEVNVADSVESAVVNSPIVTTVTRSDEPFLTSEMLSPGCHLNAVGAVLPSKAEFTADVLSRASRVVVDSPDNVKASSREFREYFEQGSGDWSSVETLGDVVSSARVRAPEDDLTVFKAMGMGISDLSVAVMALHRARERGVGHEFAAPVVVQPKWNTEKQ